MGSMAASQHHRELLGMGPAFQGLAPGGQAASVLFLFTPERVSGRSYNLNGGDHTDCAHWPQRVLQAPTNYMMPIHNLTKLDV